MPATPSDFSAMSIEQPQKSGVGPTVTAVEPNNIDLTARIEPTQSSDTTVRIKPHHQEPT